MISRARILNNINAKYGLKYRESRIGVYSQANKLKCVRIYKLHSTLVYKTHNQQQI
jgi:hypothetical protein